MSRYRRPWTSERLFWAGLGACVLVAAAATAIAWALYLYDQIARIL